MARVWTPGPLALRHIEAVTSISPGDFWADSQRAELYADLRAAGSLAAAVGQVAATLGLDVGEMSSTAHHPLEVELEAVPQHHRHPLEITCAREHRSFTIRGRGRGVWLIGGSTSELEEVVGAAALWRSGARLAEFRSAFPWTRVSELAFAHERGPADAVAVQWSHVDAQMRGSMDGEPFDRGIRLVEAAYAEPRLRQLFPYLSHWVLGLSRCTGYPFTTDIPWIGYAPSGDGYEVRRHGWGWDETERVLAAAATAEEAVALVVDRLPEGTGPAVAGTCDDL